MGFDEDSDFFAMTKRARHETKLACPCGCHWVNTGAAGCECDICGCMNLTDCGTRMVSRREVERSRGFEQQ